MGRKNKNKNDSQAGTSSTSSQPQQQPHQQPSQAQPQPQQRQQGQQPVRRQQQGQKQDQQEEGQQKLHQQQEKETASKQRGKNKNHAQAGTSSTSSQPRQESQEQPSEAQTQPQRHQRGQGSQGQQPGRTHQQAQKHDRQGEAQQKRHQQQEKEAASKQQQQYPRRDEKQRQGSLQQRPPQQQQKQTETKHPQQHQAWGPSADPQGVPMQQQGTYGPPAAQPAGKKHQQGGWGRGAQLAGPMQQQGAYGPSAAQPVGPMQKQGGWGRAAQLAGPMQQQGACGPSAAQPTGQMQQQGGWGRAAQPTGQMQQQSAYGPSAAQPAGPMPTTTQQAASTRNVQPKSQTPSPQYTPRQTSISQSSSTSSFSSTKSQKSIPPGTLGIRGECETNYLILNLDKMPDKAYHYDVSITPDRPKKFFRPAFKQFINTYLSGCTVAFDGVKSCYMVKILPKPIYEGDVSVQDSGTRQIQFRVCIKPTDNTEIDLRSLKTYHNERVFDKPMRALQCIEVVLANACHDKGIRAGRSYFTPPQQRIDLEEGYELYTGLYQAAILGDEPYLNVDISHKSFPIAFQLTEYLEKILNAQLQNGLDPRSYQNLCSHLRGMNIRYNPPPSFGAASRVYKVNDVSRDSASLLTFTNDQGEKLSVQKYFASKGYNLKYPKLNCIVAGSTVKPNYLPIELCEIEKGQPLRRKDGSRQVQNMIRYAATSTDVRKGKIFQKLQYFMHNADNLVRGFGIQLGNAFIQVPTRLLKPPSIEYRSNKCIEPRNGSWRNIEFLATGATRAREGHKWAIIYTNSRSLRHSTLQDLSSMLYREAQRMGINLSEQREIKETRNIVQTLEEFRKAGYDLVVVVIPNFGTSYAEIKQKAELVCGLLTQCIKEKTLNRVNPQLIGNLLLKVNSKLNGSNHKIADKTNINLDHVMFMGADVTHPSPDQRNIPSVVGVAASHDRNGATYNMQYRLQEPTKEEIVDMQSICRHHLSVYFKRQNCYPKSIIYYRDGVSDGQFQKVEMLELNAIRAVCKELRISPKLTCIIVVKRHHTRFFPTKPTGDKFNNVLPGTVVDQKIVHPNETQFFMVSHQSIQGTAKPTRYNVIVDDAKMSMDELQKITNNLCYMFPRCNRAVSYPAPAYLAHLVAARGRVYIEGPPLRRELREEYNRRKINEQFMNTTPMFFV